MSTTTTTTPSSAALAPARPGRSYDAYPIQVPREVSPGLMSDGTLSASHPLVQRFLAHTARKFLDTEARAATAGKHKHNRWHGAHKHPLVTRWRCMHGGGARVADVHDALGPGVTARLARAIFALGALSVYSYWARPAHWAFWAVNVVEETAAVVHEVVRADAKVIHVPDEVAWVDAQMAVNVLRVWHGGFVPRQKKKKPAVSDAAEENSDGKTKNANGKRSAPDDGPPPPPKKQRTSEKKSLLPTRQSARICKCVQENPAPSPTPDAASTPAPETAKPFADEPEDMVVDVESIEPVGTVEESRGEAEEAPVAQSAKKPRSRPVRTRKSTVGRKRKVIRKPRVPPGNTPSAKQQVPAPPSPASPGTIRIPARSTPPSASASPSLAARKLLDAVIAPQFASAPPGSGETPAAASRESTAVGTPCSGLSTRVGTPQPEFEVKVEPVAMKATVVREIPTPVRSSARIRAKGLRGVSRR